MTVLRREDVQSGDASWDGGPYRIVKPPIPAIVPLIIRRLRGPSPNRITLPFVETSVACRCLPRRGCDGLQRRPQEAREFARDRHGDFRRRLVVLRQASESTTQSLLCLVGNRNHAARLPRASSRQGDADAGAMLVMPRRFHQQPANQRIARPRDAATSVLLPGGVFTGYE